MRTHARYQRGSTMIVVLVILVALLGAGAIALYLQVSNTRASGMVRRAKASLYCAEAGLSAAKDVIGANATLWPELLDGNTGTDPPWYPIEGDLDGDGVTDYIVTVRDNDDEVLPAANDPTNDLDGRLFVVSRCVTHDDVQREVLELTTYDSSGFNYRDQGGQGAGGTGNTN